MQMSESLKRLINNDDPKNKNVTVKKKHPLI